MTCHALRISADGVVTNAKRFNVVADANVPTTEYAYDDRPSMDLTVVSTITKALFGSTAFIWILLLVVEIPTVPSIPL